MTDVLNEQLAAETRADEWATMLPQNEWENAAASIRRRHPLPYGETTQVQQDGFTLEVSDSWRWAGQDGSDICLTMEGFGSQGPHIPLSVRTLDLRKP